MELTNQEIKAIKEALELLGYYDVAESKNTMQEWLADDAIGICTCRSGRTAAYIITDCEEACVYVDTLEQLTDVQIERELL